MLGCATLAKRCPLGKRLFGSGKTLQWKIGLRTIVSPVAVHALDPHTGLSQTSKIKRLIDKRKTT